MVQRLLLHRAAVAETLYLLTVIQAWFSSVYASCRRKKNRQCGALDSTESNTIELLVLEHCKASLPERTLCSLCPGERFQQNHTSSYQRWRCLELIIAWSAFGRVYCIGICTNVSLKHSSRLWIASPSEIAPHVVILLCNSVTENDLIIPWRSDLKQCSEGGEAAWG